MVMYRDFVTRHARALGVTGEVKNMPDGTVSVVAEGEESALMLLIEKLKRGPLLAYVEAVRVVWKDATHAFTDFNIVYR